jgi:hypothetical protein
MLTKGWCRWVLVDVLDRSWKSATKSESDPGNVSISRRYDMGSSRLPRAPILNSTSLCPQQVIIPQACTLVNPTLDNCDNLRGNVFSYDNSSSWTIDRAGTSTPLTNNGTFHLLTIEEGKLGLVGNAYYGFDTIRLGLDGSGLPSVQNQVIAGIATNDFWLGSLGLSPLSFNFTDFSDPLPSLLSTLRDEGRISSISWSYTAGAHYLDPPVFGSLTLGGYDESQFDTASALRDIPFGADVSRDLLVNLEGLAYDSSDSKRPLLAESIYVFIDSLVSQMWLPIDACKRFEDAFSLTWNASAQFYYIPEATHSALVSQNPTFTFTFGSGGRTVDISLPYAAFDLELSKPYVNGTARYFPLKQANDSSQYTLGRAFLQEAYVVADYDRHNFTMAQAKHPSASVEQNLMAITPPGTTTETTNGSGLGAGAIAGTVLGAVLGLIVVLGGWLWFIRRRRWRAKIKREPYPDEVVHELHEKATAQDAVIGHEIHGGERYEMGQEERVVELQAGRLAQELDNPERMHELEGTPVR